MDLYKTFFWSETLLKNILKHEKRRPLNNEQHILNISWNMGNTDLWIMNSHDAGAGLQPEVPLRQVLRTEAAQQPAAARRIASHIRGQPVVNINRILRTPDLNTAISKNWIGQQCGHGHVQGQSFKTSREICQQSWGQVKTWAMCPVVKWRESWGLARIQPDITVCLISVSVQVYSTYKAIHREWI